MFFQSSSVLEKRQWAFENLYMNQRYGTTPLHVPHYLRLEHPDDRNQVAFYEIESSPCAVPQPHTQYATFLNGIERWTLCWFRETVTDEWQQQQDAGVAAQLHCICLSCFFVSYEQRPDLFTHVSTLFCIKRLPSNHAICVQNNTLRRSVQSLPYETFVSMHDQANDDASIVSFALLGLDVLLKISTSHFIEIHLNNKHMVLCDVGNLNTSERLLQIILSLKADDYFEIRPYLMKLDHLEPFHVPNYDTLDEMLVDGIRFRVGPRVFYYEFKNGHLSVHRIFCGSQSAPRQPKTLAHLKQVLQDA